MRAERRQERKLLLTVAGLRPPSSPGAKSEHTDKPRNALRRNWGQWRVRILRGANDHDDDYDRGLDRDDDHSWRLDHHDDYAAGGRMWAHAGGRLSSCNGAQVVDHDRRRRRYHEALFKWKWRGAATDVTAVGDFKDPVHGTPTLRTCVYDASGNLQPLMQGADPPRWHVCREALLEASWQCQRADGRQVQEQGRDARRAH
jgi:hypothetical protein